MKILIVYDSFFGNTQKIGEEISKYFSKENDVILKKVSDLSERDLKKLDLLIVGSPTRAFSPSEDIKKFLNDFSTEGLDFLVFDTRIDENDAPKFLKFLMKLFGYADKKMVKLLKKKGCKEVHKSEGFFVKDKEGPLKEGEIEKVTKWLKTKY